MTIREQIESRLNQGLSNGEIAGEIYGDRTERAQRRVRAFKSKLAHVSHSNSNASNASEHCASVGARLNSKVAVAGGCEVANASVAGFGSRVGYVLERDVITAVVCDEKCAAAVKRLATRVSNAGFGQQTKRLQSLLASLCFRWTNFPRSWQTLKATDRNVVIWS